MSLFSRRTLLSGMGAGLGASLMKTDLARALLPQQRAYLTSQAIDYIDVIAGQSNEIYGVPFTPGLDLGDSRFFQMFSGNEGTSNHVSNGGANDPLDNPDTSGQATPAIGNAVHFYRDWFIPNVNPRRVLFLPCAYGGTSVIQTGLTAWGVTTAKGGAAVGSLTTNMIARVALARQLWPSAKLIFRFECIEQDTAGYSAFAPYILNHFRGAYLDWILYVRAQLAAIGYPDFPIIIGRPTPYILTTTDTEPGGFTWIPSNVGFADAIVRALYNRVPNVGVADSQAPAAATSQSSTEVHFDHSGQVTMASRYWSAYQNAIGNTLFPTYPVWDTTDVLTSAAGFSSGFTLGAGGSTLAGDANSGWKSALATCPSQPSTSAMLYAEIKATAVASSGNIMFGLCNQGADLYSYLGNASTNPVMADYGSAGYFCGNTSLCATGGSGSWAQASFPCPNVISGDVIQIAVNRASGKAWVGKNGTWLNSGAPASGASPWVTGIPSTDMVFLGASIYSGAGNSLSINGNSSQFAYSPPSGFQPWGH